MTVGIVTGAARGMGAASAERVADLVDVLFLVDRDEAAVRAAADALSSRTHAAVEYFALDVKDQGAITAMLERAAAAGPLRAVAHAAGVSPTMADWREILAVDLVGTAMLVDGCRALSTEGTAVVCFASISALLAIPDADSPPDAVLDDPLHPEFIDRIREAVGDTIEDPGMAYTWAKRGVHRLVRREAVPFGRVGARICSVTPGIIDTLMGRQEAEAHSVMDMLVGASAAGRQGVPEEVANAVAFLLSDEARYITGIDLPVDGGVVASVRTGGLANL
jgi:NAD(P)-dependent dehydrogenase (short-subunit alcohol dehydrogenase family)